MFREERQRYILELMRSGAAVKVSDLSAKFGASESTIRRDLAELEQSGLLERTHGGAVPADSTREELTFAERTDRNLAEKMAIARVAFELVQDGDSIILDAGSTTMEIARLLKHRRDLTVVTNALHIAAELGDAPGIEVLMTGGRLKRNTLAQVGPIAERMLSEINADRVFLGANGLDLSRGLTTPTQEEAEIKRCMIAAARQVVVVADHTKVGRVAFATIAPITSAHILITDKHCDASTAAELTRQGVQVLLADD